jgi:hypothetical protein
VNVAVSVEPHHAEVQADALRASEGAEQGQAVAGQDRGEVGGTDA